jgi:hypothetical protein
MGVLEIDHKAEEHAGKDKESHSLDTIVNKRGEYFPMVLS